MIDFKPLVLLPALLLVLASASHGDEVHEGDVILSIKDNAIVTGRFHDDALHEEHVWTADFGSDGFPDFTSEPGYDALPGTFEPGTAVGVSIRKALRVWDDSAGNFDAIASPEFVSISRFANTITTPRSDPEPGETLPMLTLGVANASGIIHTHAEYTLDHADSPAVFLLELELWTDDERIAPSEPFWIVFNQNHDEAVHDDAADWVEANLAGHGCSEDLNGDSHVNVSDLLQLLAVWGDSDDSDADLNSDGQVDVSDLLLLLSAWGDCPQHD